MKIKIKIEHYEDRNKLFSILARNGFTVCEEVEENTRSYVSKYYVVFSGDIEIKEPNENHK